MIVTDKVSHIRAPLQKRPNLLELDLSTGEILDAGRVGGWLWLLYDFGLELKLPWLFPSGDPSENQLER